MVVALVYCAFPQVEANAAARLNAFFEEHETFCSGRAYLIPCKAAGLEWPTVSIFLTSRCFGRTMSEDDLVAKADYLKLSLNNARRALRFWQVRRVVSKDDAAASTVLARGGRCHSTGFVGATRDRGTGAILFGRVRLASLPPVCCTATCA